MYVSCGFRDAAVRLPVGPYYKGAGEYELFVVEGSGDRLVKRRVTLGDSNSSHVEVRSGLQPGDRVATGDMEQYRKYSKLKIK